MYGFVPETPLMTSTVVQKADVQFNLNSLSLSLWFYRTTATFSTVGKKPAHESPNRIIQQSKASHAPMA